ncbi:MAG: glycosyl transferase family 2 [Firmicutes bacterium]|nr:glycosyl transferase family 2 [Bacillota bacterium]
MIKRISLAMIVRDEEANLAECLGSVKDEVDEIVIVDTGSTDQTLNIASNFTNKIYHFPWQGDFSAARNFAISKCSGQWILSLDADEKLDSEKGSIRQLIGSSPETEVFGLSLLIYSATEYERFTVMRLFRNTAEYHFVGKIHEQVVINNTNVVDIGDAPVICHKFVTHKQRNKKRWRNLRLLKHELHRDPDNYYLKYYMGVEWLGIGRYERAVDCLQTAVASISLYQPMFRGPAVRYLVDCLKFLGRPDEALEICQNECELNPDFTDVFFETGAILEEQGKFKQAIDYFLKAIQLGDPPLWLFHSKGTESFLACYHLAFCYEKIGLYELAENYYWQALETNPKYTCPLYSLFLMKITNLKPSEVFDYFNKKNSFLHDQWATTLAMLFFEVGLPELAAQCYEQSLTLRGDTSINRIRSLLYSGCVQKALDLINSMDRASIAIEIKIEEILAHILNGDFSTAKRWAFDLWVTSPEQRSKAWAMLTIIARMSSSPGYSRPEKSREGAVIELQLLILENCLRFSPKYLGITCDGAFKKLVKTVTDILMDSSVESNMKLIDYMQGKAENLRSMLYYKYTAARGLYL